MTGAGLAAVLHEIGFGYTHDGLIQTFCAVPDCGWKGAPEAADAAVAEAAGHQAEATEREGRLATVREAAHVEGAVAEVVTAIERIKLNIDSTACPSNSHGEPVPATVAGLFLNPYREDATSSPVSYCGPCAKTGEDLGFFTPTGGTE